MCCLYGLMDPNLSLNGKEKSKLMRRLATAAEERGTDATGYALNRNGRLFIHKRPVPGHKLQFRIRDDTVAVTGHNRLTTQGNAAFNYNNHPFSGTCGGTRFALAHNGVLWNDRELRSTMRLPETEVETDSYIAVQLVERKKTLDFAGLRYMAEQVRGTFTFTVLTQDNSLYIVKGDSPLHLVRFRQTGLFLYASTKSIMRMATHKLPFLPDKAEEISLDCGDILKIDALGRMSREQFDDTALLMNDCYRYWPEHRKTAYSQRKSSFLLEQYLENLRWFAVSEGFEPDFVDGLAESGIPLSEIEEYICEMGIHAGDGMLQMEF